jgi:hypothetical protein
MAVFLDENNTKFEKSSTSGDISVAKWKEKYNVVAARPTYILCLFFI